MPHKLAPVSGRGERGGVRRAELVAAISLGADLGLGQPMEHVLRSCALALRLGERAGLDESQRETTFYVAMVAWIGCSADAHELARWFGDDLSFRADSYQVDLTGPATALFLVRHLGAGGGPFDRLRAAGSFLRDGVRDFDPMRTHCEVASSFARRLGVGDAVTSAVVQAFERWDGKGEPEGLAGDSWRCRCGWCISPRSPRCFIGREGSMRRSRWRASGGPLSSTRRWSMSSARTRPLCWLGSTPSRPGSSSALRRLRCSRCSPRKSSTRPWKRWPTSPT